MVDVASLEAAAKAAQRLISSSQRLWRQFSSPSARIEARSDPGGVAAKFLSELGAIDELRSAHETALTAEVWKFLAKTNAGLTSPFVVIDQRYTLAHEAARRFSDCLITVPIIAEDDPERLFDELWSLSLPGAEELIIAINEEHFRAVRSLTATRINEATDDQTGQFVPGARQTKDGTGPANCDKLLSVQTAVCKAGKTASPKRVNNFLSSGMKKQDFLRCLRQLEKDGKYAGFRRRRRGDR